MATARAIAAAVEGVAASLRRRYPRSQFGNGLAVNAVAPAGLRDAMANDGISVVLWRVTVNGHARARPPRRDALGRIFRPSLPVDLSLLVVPHAGSVETQHRLLGWVLRAFEDQPSFPAVELNQALGGADVFRPDEAAELVAEPLAVADHLALWDRLRDLPPAAFYQLRMLLLDGEEPLEEAAPVLTRAFEIGPAVP